MWKQVQQQWMYLENIFQSPDIKKTLGKEASLFDQADKFFKGLMLKTKNMKNAFRLMKGNNALLDNLET